MKHILLTISAAAIALTVGTAAATAEPQAPSEAQVKEISALSSRRAARSFPSASRMSAMPNTSRAKRFWRLRPRLVPDLGRGTEGNPSRNDRDDSGKRQTLARLAAWRLVPASFHYVDGCGNNLDGTGGSC